MYVRCFVKKQDLLVVVGHHVIVVVVGGDSFKVERQRTDTIPACGAAQAGKHLGPRTCKTLVQKMVISLSQHGITTRSKAAVEEFCVVMCPGNTLEHLQWWRVLPVQWPAVGTTCLANRAH